MAKRILLLGAGHAHLHALRRAAEVSARGHALTVVAPDRFWYSGLATGMLGGEHAPEFDGVDVAALAARGGARFVAGAAARVDPAARRAHLRDGTALEYDALSLNLGSEAPPIPGEDALPEAAFAAKPIRRVAELRAALERRLADAPGVAVRVAVAGGGATAFELAANVRALAARRGGRAAVTVLAGGDAVLRQLPPAAARRVVRALDRRGVRLRTGARVARVEPGRAVLEAGGDEPFDLFVNATGLVPNAALRACGLPVDAAGALVVDAHLRSVADPAVHGGGDGVALEGHALPRVGVHAIRQGPVLLANLLAAVEGTAPRRFAPQRRHLWVMNLGDGTGLAARGGLWWHGRAAHWLKDRIDRRFLAGHRRAAGQAA